MNCPNCGAPEKAPVKVCRSCGEAFASQDLLELYQLEFLIEETASWEEAKALRLPYIERLDSLRSRLHRLEPVRPEVAAEAVPAPAPEPVPEKPQPAPQPTPPKEQVPFDQWLLSERNIKTALYSGAALLVLAGLIFIGVNWTRIPGPVKFAITFMVTGLMYLGGYLLFQRPVLRLGGSALLGVASGFLALNFAVLQIYILGPNGLRNDVMWLIASPLCLLLYLLTAYWTKNDLFTYISLIAVVSTLTAALVVTGAPLLVYVLAYAILSLVVLLLARFFQSTRLVGFTFQPLLFVSQGGIFLVIVAAIALWFEETGCKSCFAGSPWLALIALGVGVSFYVTTDTLFKWLASRWAAAVLFPVTFGMVLIESGFTSSAMGITLMFLALAYLGAGYALERREGQRSGAWSLCTTAYAVAVFVTLQATQGQATLVNVLFGDVILLGVSAAIFRDYKWVYGAVWLFMLPVYLLIDLFVPALHNQGLLMGVLCLNYAAAGYALGRRELRLGGPFLTAAAALTVVAAMLAWGNPVVASLVLVVAAVLYVLAAIWVGWDWLLYPALVAVNLVVFSINDMVFSSTLTMARSLVISYTALGVVLALGGLSLWRAGNVRWAWPLYLIGALDLAGAYLAGLGIGGWLAIGLSAALAMLLLAFAWLERAEFLNRNWPPVLTYLGIAAIFVGHFFALDLAAGATWNVWPVYTASLCTLFIALAWVVRRESLAGVYTTPLKRAGLWLMAVP